MEQSASDKLIEKINSLFKASYADSVLLLIMVVVAMIWANSEFYESYNHLFHSNFTIGFEGFAITEPLHIWINDGLMAMFFFIVGLEIKKEFLEGELSTVRKALLPIVAAIGGMVLPAVIFLGFNYGTEAQGAWGIPMATDIAFALGLVGLVGTAVSSELKIFLTSLATADDLGAILVIAIFLTPSIDGISLFASGVYLLIMIFANSFGVRNMWFYIIVGIFGLWIAILLSGIHATLAGVLGAFTIPANRKILESEYRDNLNIWAAEFDESCSVTDRLLSDKQRLILRDVNRSTARAGTPLQRIEYKLSPFVYYFVLPLFALANAGVRIEGNLFDMMFHPLSLGIIAGLVVGKVVGITGLSYMMVKSRLGDKPVGATWSSMFGVGLFAGIGFTMSLFIAELAIEDKQLLDIAKVGILTASTLAALLGLFWFSILNRRNA